MAKENNVARWHIICRFETLCCLATNSPGQGLLLLAKTDHKHVKPNYCCTKDSNFHLLPRTSKRTVSGQTRMKAESQKMAQRIPATVLFVSVQFSSLSFKIVFVLALVLAVTCLISYHMNKYYPYKKFLFWLWVLLRQVGEGSKAACSRNISPSSVRLALTVDSFSQTRLDSKSLRFRHFQHLKLFCGAHKMLSPRNSWQPTAPYRKETFWS